MKPAEQARLHLQTLLARGVAIRDAREPLGVTGVSEIWGALEPRDKPGWYLWIQHCPGVFGIDLEGADAAEDSVAQCARAYLSLRHYPAPTAPTFHAFSREEREIVNRGWLDETGAPDVQRAASIPPALFLIGALELTFTDEPSTRAISLGAPERLGSVPAWELALPLFAALVGFVAQSERRSAVRLVETADDSHRSAVVSFDPAASCPHGLDPYVDAEASIVRDEPLSRFTTAVPDGSPSRTLQVNRSWFVEGEPAPQQLGCCR